MFAGKAKESLLHKGEPESVFSLGILLALTTNIRVRWKSLPGTIPLAYSEYWYTALIKSFITLASG
jgi:hypothetical protein